MALAVKDAVRKLAQDHANNMKMDMYLVEHLGSWQYGRQRPPEGMFCELVEWEQPNPKR